MKKNLSEFSQLNGLNSRKLSEPIFYQDKTMHNMNSDFESNITLIFILTLLS